MLDLLAEKTEQVGEKGTRPDGEGGREAADVEREKPLGVGGRIKKLTHRFHEWILKKRFHWWYTKKDSTGGTHRMLIRNN
jgi:hypothetical protein